MIPDIAFTPGNGRSIEIIDLQSLQQRKSGLNHNPEAPHRVEFYILIQIEQGQGEHFIDFKKYRFGPDSLIFINKHQVHAFDFSQPLQGRLMMFTDDFIYQVQANTRTPLFSPLYLTSQWQPVFTPATDIQERCKALINEVALELADSHCQEIVIMLLFSALLMIVMREKTGVADVKNQKQLATFNRFAGLLEARFTQTRDANNYADWLNITYKTLNQLCKQVSQQTAKQVIDNYTILEAKRRLTIHDQPGQQLAYELGFDEPTNFVKYFKKHTQLTPSQFRKKNNPLS